MDSDPAVSELLRLRAEHQAIREALPSAWSAFFARFDRLRDVQLAVMPLLFYHVGQFVVDTFVADRLAGRPVEVPRDETVVRG